MVEACGSTRVEGDRWTAYIAHILFSRVLAAFASNVQHENDSRARQSRHFVNALWKLRVVLKGSVCVRVRIRMHMASLRVNV